MTRQEEAELCKKYFYELAEKLKETHEIVKSCNKDETLYLIPKGTIDQLSYYGKPVDSYRYSDHWNWYANTRKCKWPHYIQCYNPERHRPKRRPSEGHGGSPIWARLVAYYGEDRKYHTVYSPVDNLQTVKEKERCLNV